jgi:hypothetical protein
MSETLQYKRWSSMVERCCNPNHYAYAGYGGRGIAVCERWRVFDAFQADMGYPPSKDHSLDRIDNDGNYEPGNCRWAHRKEQMRNRSNTIVVEYNGAKRSLSEWAEILDVSYNTLFGRYANGDRNEFLFRPIDTRYSTRRVAA